MIRENHASVVVAGHVCLDVIPSFPQKDEFNLRNLLQPGKLVTAERVAIATGGPVSNTGIAMSILGIDTMLMGKIGKDFLGEGILKRFSERKLEKGLIEVEGEDTSYTIVIAPPGSDRVFLHHPGANHTFCSEDIRYDVVKHADLFHFGYPPLMRKMYEKEGDELVKIFSNVKELGVTTSLDMSLPDASSDSGKADWEKILKKLLPFVDIFLPSVEEILFMIDRPEYNSLNENAEGHEILDRLDMNKLPDLGERLLFLGAKIAVIKCGVKGFFIRTQSKEVLEKMGKAKPVDLNNWSNRELHAESFHVANVASATGSGDSSIAGFLSALLKGRSIEETIKIACAVGGQNVQVYDAISGIKPWEETLTMIPGWESNRLMVKGDYWSYHNEEKVWAGKKDIRFNKEESQ